MPNAKDYTGTPPHKFLLLGNTGTGKTSQLLTLPGKKFAYLFDPNALISLRGHDIDYEEFLPTGVSLDLKSLSKDASGNLKGDRVAGYKGSTVFTDWEKDFEDKKKSGFFQRYDVIALDSATTILDMMMDRVLTINGRAGQFPQQDDWGPQMVGFTNLMRELSGMGKMIYLTGHLITDKDENTQKVTQLPLFTGRLREKIPLLFSDVMVTTAVTDDGKGTVRYLLRTVPNQRETPIRTGIKGLRITEDVTIDWSKPVVGQGLGGLLLKDTTTK